jgi:hypothetical protein
VAEYSHHILWRRPHKDAGFLTILRWSAWAFRPHPPSPNLLAQAHFGPLLDTGAASLVLDRSLELLKVAAARLAPPAIVLLLRLASAAPVRPLGRGDRGGGDGTGGAPGALAALSLAEPSLDALPADLDAHLFGPRFAPSLEEALGLERALAKALELANMAAPRGSGAAAIAAAVAVAAAPAGAAQRATAPDETNGPGSQPNGPNGPRCGLLVGRGSSAVGAGAVGGAFVGGGVAAADTCSFCRGPGATARCAQCQTAQYCCRACQKVRDPIRRLPSRATLKQKGRRAKEGRGLWRESSAIGQRALRLELKSILGEQT